MKEITIIWIGKDGEEIRRTATGEEDTPENRADIDQYIDNDGHDFCTEGLDAPDEWDQYDLVGEEVA